MAAMFVLCGFAGIEAYEDRVPTWERDSRYPDLDAATAAAQAWLVAQ